MKECKSVSTVISFSVCKGQGTRNLNFFLRVKEDILRCANLKDKQEYEGIF